jgi:ABC-type Fe3+ transport system substrate-binding protein
MRKNLWLPAAFAVVLIGPLALRPKTAASAKADRTLVIITPHNEATRYEFGRAFDAFYFRAHGQHVRIDWRTPGGTSEISRYLASEYLAAFENYWTNKLHRPWNAAVQAAFDNPKAAPGDPAREAFLKSDVGCGLDLFFGGGSFDLALQANAGRLVDCGVIAKHAELFNNNVIPQNLGGEPYWDPQGRWVGDCLSSFGICYNTDSLARLKIEKPPAQWVDLADPRYIGQIALADPTQSASLGKVFEMMIQQQMLHVPKFKVTNFTQKMFVDAKGSEKDISEIEVKDMDIGAQETVMIGDVTNLHLPFKLGDAVPESIAIRLGWLRAMNIIQKISANARYFADDSKKVPFDVEHGDAAAGMCIDFYGRFQSEAVRKPDGSSRMQYVTPDGGSSVGVDPIGLLRGAPDAELAREFIEFVISPDGQKLWNWKTGTPGGPEKYALRRLPILPQLYAPEFAALRSDPQVQPYAQAGAFVYHPEWTSQLFRPIGFIVRVMCIDPHDELREAWRALIAANFPPQASAVFFDVSKVDYAAASGAIRETLRSPDKIAEVKLAKTLGDSFRAQYLRAAELAREGK